MNIARKTAEYQRQDYHKQHSEIKEQSRKKILEKQKQQEQKEKNATDKIRKYIKDVQDYGGMEKRQC